MNVKEDTRAPQGQAEKWTDRVERNLPLVSYVLSKVAGNLPPSVDRDDLMAAGSLGLTEAARNYDAARGVPFHNYAVPRIWGAMLDELRRHDWLSADARKQVKRMNRSIADLRREGHDSPTIEQISDNLGCSTNQVARLMNLAGRQRQSLGSAEPAGEAEEVGLRHRHGGTAPRGPYEEAEFRDQKEALARAIHKLPDREKQVIVLHYHEGLLLREIGEALGVTESRVCQIHSQAVARLRTVLKCAV
jgi:RNA polymerase sigma factor for flagellar operon FliA